MKFTRLRVAGFKSFAEPTDMPIEPGLTGVVGPNGCGKSNLTEALQWVMGESSYKAMRGSGMEDVIFSGSGARPGRNAAEVTLFLDNADRSAPAAFNDSDAIEITRRIERETGSSYRLNGREIRARDVQILFADASAGARSPAMVGQGRVSALIAAKPEARRAVLEEAAGIAGLFGRRQEAELRLKGAEQNLERLEDVLAELERQLEGLRRQARQAARFRTLSSDIRKGEAAALAIRYGASRAAVDESEAELRDITGGMADAATELGEATRGQTELAARLPELRNAAASAAATVQRFRLEAEHLEAEERAARSRIAEVEARLNQFRADLVRERRLIEDDATDITRLTTESETNRSESASATVKRAEIAARLAAAEGALAESEKATAEIQGALAELRARRSQVDREIEEARRQERSLGDEATRIAAERQGLAVGAGKQRIENASARLGALAAALATADATVTSAEAAAEAARSNETAARNSLAEADQLLAKNEAEASALSSLLPARDVEHPLFDLVTPADGAEAALAAVFGDELQLGETEGRAAYWRTVLPATNDPPLPDGARPLADMVEAPLVLARRLSQTGVVDRSDGPRLQLALKPGQSLASPEGDLWRWDGLVAAAGSRRAEADRLAARKRLRDLTAAIVDFRARAGTARTSAADATAALRQALAAASSARDARRSALKAFETGQAEVSTAEREQARLDLRLATLAEAEGRVMAMRSDAVRRREIAEAATADLVSSASLDPALTDLKDKVAAQRALVFEARAELAALDRDQQHRGSRLRAIETEQAAWRKRLADAEAQAAALGVRIGETEAERDGLAGTPDDYAGKRAELLTRMDGAEAERSRTAQEVSEAESAQAIADRAVQLAQNKLSEIRERRGRVDERLANARLRMMELAQKISDTLHCSPEEAAKAAGFGKGPLPALDQVDARIERLRQERERLGGVNLQAEQEAVDLDGRRNALIAERDDLVAAIHKLRQGIGSLNREGRERLLEAFTSVNARFQELFTTLFGGGTAELKLTDAEDPLEAGLEIIARPPGKKPQTMTLLSGGEQALTALSLIFAVFLTKPAPICVLDEVDAPLDDANVERFCTLLEEISRRSETRFLVTTHNPITMSRMNRLFGVTMAERGVSQLVSVDLDAAERFREAV